jgi:hypothetical protein
VYDKMAYTLYGNSAITNFGVAAAAASTCRVPQFIHRLRAKLDEWTLQQQAQQQLRQVTPFATAATLGIVGAGGQLPAGTWSPSAGAGLTTTGSVLAPATPGSILGMEQQLQAPTNGSYMLLTAPQQVMPSQQQQPQQMVAQNNVYLDMAAATGLPVWSSNHIVPTTQYPAGLVDTPSLAQPSYLQPYTQGCIPTPPQQALQANPAKLQPFPGAGGSPVLGLDLLPAWARQLPTAAAAAGEGALQPSQAPSQVVPQQQLAGLQGMSQPEPSLAAPGVLVYSSSTTPSGPSWQVALDCTLDAPPTSANLPPATPGRLSVTDRGPGVPLAGGLDLAALLRKQQLLQGYTAKAQQAGQQQLDAATLAAAMGSMPLVGSGGLPAGNAASSGVDTLGWSMDGLALV